MMKAICSKTKLQHLQEGSNLYNSCHVSNLEYNNTSQRESMSVEKLYHEQESEKICVLCGFSSVL